MTSNNYRVSVTGNGNNVTLNAYVNCVYRQLLRCNVTTCVKLRYVRFVNAVKHAEIGGFMAKNIVFCKCVGRRMTGIVKILLRTVRTFSMFVNCNKNAHRNFLKLYYVENTVLLSLGLALKIRVSVVRFRPRPPFIRRSMGNRATLFYCTNVAGSIARVLAKCCGFSLDTRSYPHPTFPSPMMAFMFDIQSTKRWCCAAS